MHSDPRRKQCIALYDHAFVCSFLICFRHQSSGVLYELKGRICSKSLSFYVGRYIGLCVGPWTKCTLTYSLQFDKHGSVSGTCTTEEGSTLKVKMMLVIGTDQMSHS